jgi:small subunit ribosomal protein S20
MVEIWSMPITKSARKALRQNSARKVRNLKKKNKVKALTKQVRKLALAKTAKEAQTLLPQVYKALDKAAKTGVLKKNAASRKKSRITKLIQKTPTKQQETQ